MTRVTAFSSPLLLGFDQVERTLDRLAKTTADGYPPYNIERLPKTAEHGEIIRIVLAVAGFAREELEIVIEENELTVRGRQAEEEARTYLHRGIAARQFQRSFLLAEGMQVLGADLAQGLLSIDLFRPQPERVVKKIQVSARD